MSTSTDGRLPGAYAPLDQLGLKITLGMENFPSNRMLMCYGPPGGGKSTLLYSLAGQYIRNGDDVWIVDGERAIDEVYFASYLPGAETQEGMVEALEFELASSKKILNKELKLSEADRTSSPDQIKILENRVEMLPKLIAEMKKGEDSGLDERTKRSLIRRARADYRLRQVEILRYANIEEFEKETMKRIADRQEDPKKRGKRLLIGVDSINYLLPGEVLDRATCSEGSNFVLAKYLHTLLPKLITKLSGLEITIFFIYQKTTTIKINFYEQKSPIDDVATKGGSAGKFGATLMINVEKRRKLEGVDGQMYDSGVIEIPKAKLREGAKSNYKGVYMLKETVESSVMDFNEPFILSVMENEDALGIVKKTGRYYVPGHLLEGHKDYETVVKPALRTLPKDEDGDKIYFHSDTATLVKMLGESPAFEEACLLMQDIMRNV